jgi:two-component system sensor histidine kinase ChvG
MIGRQLGRIRTRLLIVNLVVLVVPVAGLEFARIHERQLLGALERDMRNQAVLTREILETALAAGTPLDEALPEEVLAHAARHTRTRVRVLDAAAEVVVDSHRGGPPEGDEPPAPGWLPDHLDLRSEPERAPAGERWPELAQRVEVRRALAGAPHSYTRIRERDPSVMLFLTEPVRVEGAVRAVVYLTRSTQPVLVQLYRIRSGLFRVLAAALGFTVLVSIVLAWSISRPLGRLARAARRIAAGQRDVEVPAVGSGEIAELAQAFRVMTQRLDSRIRYISEFSADVAHEFKSPLTSIRGAAELLLEGAAEDRETRERFLHNIQLDAERLERLVSRLLELSRIEASTEPMEDVAVSTVIDRVIERTHTSEQPVEVRGGGGLTLRGRVLDLERALLNLVENALRFSPPGEPVVVSAESDGVNLRLSVCDRGPGVPDAHRERIFERFFTTDAERSGTGLGLAIVRTVAEAHGGRVELENPDRGEAQGGKGACFALVLPLRV